MTETLSEQDARVRKLIEWDTMLTELRQHPGWGVYEHLVQESVGHWQNRLNSGDLNQDDYKFTAGFLKGAREMLNVHSVVSARLARAQDDAAFADDDDRAYAAPVTD